MRKHHGAVMTEIVPEDDKEIALMEAFAAAAADGYTFEQILGASVNMLGVTIAFTCDTLEGSEKVAWIVGDALIREVRRVWLIDHPH